MIARTLIGTLNVLIIVSFWMMPPFDNYFLDSCIVIMIGTLIGTLEKIIRIGLPISVREFAETLSGMFTLLLITVIFGTFMTFVETLIRTPKTVLFWITSTSQSYVIELIGILIGTLTDTLIRTLKGTHVSVSTLIESIEDMVFLMLASILCQVSITLIGTLWTLTGTLIEMLKRVTFWMFPGFDTYVVKSILLGTLTGTLIRTLDGTPSSVRMLIETFIGTLIWWYIGPLLRTLMGTLTRTLIGIL